MELQRPSHSAQEIARLPAVGTADCEVYVRGCGIELSAETLVYLLREGSEAGKTSLFDHCGYLLIGRRDQEGRCTGGHCEAIIMSIAVHFGFHLDEETLMEYRSRCHYGMWRAIYAGRDRKPHWEERFGHALKDLCLDVADSMHRQRRRAALHDQLDNDSYNAPDPTALMLDREVVGTIEEAELVSAIHRLPPRQARAAFLAWVEGRPIAANTNQSITVIMNIGERAVHKLLAKAKAALLEDPDFRMRLDN